MSVILNGVHLLLVSYLCLESKVRHRMAYAVRHARVARSQCNSSNAVRSRWKIAVAIAGQRAISVLSLVSSNATANGSVDRIRLVEWLVFSAAGKMPAAGP